MSKPYSKRGGTSGAQPPITYEEFAAEFDALAKRHGLKWESREGEWPRHIAIRAFARSIEFALCQYREGLPPSPSRVLRDHIAPTQSAAARLLARLNDREVDNRIHLVLREKEVEHLRVLLSKVCDWKEELEHDDDPFDDELEDVSATTERNDKVEEMEEEDIFEYIIRRDLGQDFLSKLDAAERYAEVVMEKMRSEPIRFDLVYSIVDGCKDAFNLHETFENDGPIKRKALCDFATKAVEILSLFEGAPKLDDGYRATRLTNEAIAILQAQEKVASMRRKIGECIDAAYEKDWG